MRRLPTLVVLLLFACCSTPLPAQRTDAVTADRLNQEGIDLAGRGEVRPAIEKLTAALDLYRKAGDERGEAKATGNLAILSAQAGEAEQALAFGERARELFARQGNRSGEATVLVTMGKLNAQLGRLQPAHDLLSAAVPLVEAEDDPQRLAVLLQFRGDVAAGLQRGDEALADLARARGVFHQIQDRFNEAACLIRAATVESLRFAFEESLARNEEALVLLDQIPDKQTAATTLRTIALTAQGLGQPLKALAAVQRELSIWEELNDRSQQAVALVDLSQLQAFLHEYPDALRSLTRASALAAGAHDDPMEAQILLQAARVDALLDDEQQGLVVSRRALEIFRERKDRRGEAEALAEIGSLHEWRLAFPEAAASLSEALGVWRDLGDKKEEARVLSRLGAVYQLAGEQQKVTGLLARARELADQVGDDDKAVLLDLVGLSHLTRDQAAKAREAFSQAQDLHHAQGDAAGEAHSLAGLGLSEEMEGDLVQALDSYLRSIILEETLQARTPLDPMKTGISVDAASSYERAVLVSLRLGRIAQAFEIAERSRTRALVATLIGLRVEGKSTEGAEWVRRERELRAALTELEQHAADAPGDSHAGERLAARRAEYNEVLAHLREVDPESAELVKPQAVSLAEVQGRLDDRTVLLSYFVTTEHAVAFIVTRGGLEAVELPATRDQLEQAVGALKSGASADSTSLSRWLIAPVAGKLRAPLVAIVPHAMLSYVPFAALRDGKRYFGTSHALFELPAAALLPMEPRRARPAAQLSPLVMAYSPAGSEPDQLPNVYSEAKSVARLFAVQPVLGTAATPAAFLSGAQGHGLVHLAAHAKLESANPLLSRIRLAPGGSSPDGFLYLHQIYGLNLPGTDLVVLSACETAAGAASQGDEVVALNRGFLHAGAAAVLASLWGADDAATRLLMEAFYRHLKNGEGKAEALQAAQAETRKRFPRPVDWAGFVLTGDPGPIVLPSEGVWKSTVGASPAGP